MNKIIRTICLFKKQLNQDDVEKLKNLKVKFESAGFLVQTIRICSPEKDLTKFENLVGNNDILLNVGRLNYDEALSRLNDFYKFKNLSFNIELSQTNLELKHVEVLFEIIKNAPANTFNFTYTFNNSPSSPYFPSAIYEQDGFAVGLQPTDLSQNANSLEEWFVEMKKVWEEIKVIGESESNFLGIDVSIAPLYEGDGSLIAFIKKLGMSFNDSVLTDTYLKITNFIKTNNPKPVGLNGLMLPALEDFELAHEYEIGNFSVERNIFLSLHSGLGIDTYPVGIDEAPEKVLNILKIIQGLSNKYDKPLAVRFVSDGVAKIGDKTHFNNQYLKDITVKKL